MNEKNHSSLSSHFAACFFEAATTNALLRFASVLALTVGMASCVPAKNYDEARTAAETEFSAHGKTRSRLEAAHQRIQTLEQTLAERERALETGESSVAAAKLETIVVGKDREAAVQLVEQLRSELARTGNHLVAYSNEKRNLAQALLFAEERVRAIEAAEKNLTALVATARDLTTMLGADMKDSGIEVGAKDGQIVLSVFAGKLFADGSDSLVVEAAPVLGAVSKVSGEHGSVRVILRAPEGASLGEARIARLHGALKDRGVPEARLVLPSRPVREAKSSEEPTTAPVAIGPVPSKEASPEGEATDPVAAKPAMPAEVPAKPTDDPRQRYEIAFAI